MALQQRGHVQVRALDGRQTLLVEHVLQVEHGIEGADPRCKVSAHRLGHLDHPKLLTHNRHHLCLPAFRQTIEDRLYRQIVRVFGSILQLEDVLQAIVVPVQLLHQLHPLLPRLVHGEVLWQDLLRGVVDLGCTSPQHRCLVFEARVGNARQPEHGLFKVAKVIDLIIGQSRNI